MKRNLLEQALDATIAKMENKTYSIIRFYRDDREREVIKTGLTLEEAQEHCNDPETSGDGWFDGYQED